MSLVILLITEYFPQTLDVDIHGGVEARNYFIAKELIKKHQVYVIASRLVNQPKKQVLDGIEVIRVGAARNYTRLGGIWQRLWFSIFAIWSGLYINFDLVEGSGLMGYLPSFILGVFKRRKKTILVADVISTYAEDAPHFSFWMATLLEKFLLQRNWNKIISISQTVKKKLLTYDIKEDKIEVVYCGVDQAEVNQLRVKKFPTNTICCVSRLAPYKRVADLLVAVKECLQTGTDVSCVIVGIGEERKHLVTLAQKLNIADRVIFYGFVPKHKDVLSIIKKSHIFCLPSLVEGFGIATIEAMSCGVPAILADTPISHEITNSRGALFFEPRNYHDLAKKITQLLKNDTIYPRLVKEGRQVVANYEWKKLGKKTDKLYTNLCSD